MPAYSVEIYKPICACKKVATREVRNQHNEKIRDCCDTCARDLVASLNAPVDDRSGRRETKAERDSYQGPHVSPDCL